jgi:hypothetical protein
VADAAPVPLAQPSPRPPPPQSVPSPAAAALERLAGRRPMPLDPLPSRAPSAGVTIGRLDVRVTPPTPAPPPARRTAPAPTGARLARGFPTFGLAQG